MNLSIVTIVRETLGSKTRRTRILTSRDRHPTARVYTDQIGARPDLLQLEIERARRHERVFTLLHVPRTAVAEDAVRLDEFADHLCLVVRQVDVVWADETGVLLLLPETGPEGADRCIRRLSSAAPSVRAGMIRRATFPNDGVTRGALLAILDGRMMGLPEQNDLPQLRVGPSTSVSAVR